MRPLLAAREGGGGGETAVKKPAERSCTAARRRETALGRQHGTRVCLKGWEGADQAWRRRWKVLEGRAEEAMAD
jgi:hypothetical protein